MEHPYSEYVEFYPGYEYTHVIEGQVSLTDPSGNRHQPLIKQYVFYAI